MLYPLKFEPIYKERIWGGNKLHNQYDRIYPDDKPIGESWEISGVDGDVSVVSSGVLAENELNELIEVYMGELVGDHVYNKFGEEFPVLIKILDTKDFLSVQVHPDDGLAKERHGAYGKTELWVIMEADPESYIYLGFNKTVGMEEYLRRVEENTLEEVMEKHEVKPGDVYFIPAGTIHAMGPGIVAAEIQQTSDVTYRISDWGRTDAEGNPRELHTELAIDALNYEKAQGLKLDIKGERNHAVTLVNTPHFTANVIELDGKMERDYLNIDSFVIYMCLSGEVILECGGGAESLMNAETVLIPAEFESVRLSGKAKIIEIYVP